VPKIENRPTTGLSRRHGPIAEGLDFSSRFVGGAMKPEPAVATTLPRPFGEIGRASVDRLAHLATNTWDGAYVTRHQRGKATAAVLEYLNEFEGETWQERWEASPLGRGEHSVTELGARRTTGVAVSPGLRSLFCLRAIQPSVLAFRRNSFSDYSSFFLHAQNDPLLDSFAEHAAAHDVAFIHRRHAVFDVCSLLTSQGIALADLTPAAMLHHGHESRRAKAIMRAGKQDVNRFPGLTAWNVLHRMGHFPAGTPTTMRAALLRGQLTCEQMVDRYPIRNRAVRQLLIDYFVRRSADTDYSSMNGLVLALAHTFWEKIQEINPDQADLRISPEVYAAWRRSIATRDDGKPRIGQDGIVIMIRSFYFDLHTWAVDEPERWARWVAPCPIPPSELRGLGKRRRQVTERSADRTRVRQPLLPVLVDHVETRYQQTSDLLERARQAVEGEPFEAGGRTYQRTLTDTDRRRHKASSDPTPVRVRDTATGEIIHIESEEESAFWDWACVETLRHSGVRIEELCELTHLSVRHYQRAHGEKIALLVIAPSKTDRERVIPMSAELFHVIAQVIRRHTRNGQPIPLLSRFDHHEKLWSPQMPFLFQRLIGSGRSVIGPAAVLAMLKRRGQELGEHHPGFRTVKFTPHDFRRIFATELVNSGLPIHIGAALLGHLNLQTTRGYVAVFDEDVVRHYMAYLTERRQVRPAEEYREATTAEWEEFEEHFDKRKVELGSCARPYGTPCQHEHACIRCPMLNVNPKMLGRLNELEADLLARRERAEAEGWFGEIEGLDLTLALLRSKRDETERFNRRTVIDLGIPTPRTQHPPETP
jgi:hypothetical protein